MVAWKSNILAKLSKVYFDLKMFDESRKNAETMYEQYAKIGEEKIKKQRFGATNYSANVDMIRGSIRIEPENYQLPVKIVDDPKSEPFSLEQVNEKITLVIKTVKKSGI